MKRVFYYFAIFIFISFMAVGSILGYLAHSYLNQTAEVKVKRDLGILAATTQGALANNDYECVEEQVFLWGELEPHIVSFKVIIDDDIELAKYVRKIQTSSILHLTQTTLLPSGRVITFSIEYDLSENDQNAAIIAVIFLSMSFCIAVVFIFFLWRILQRLAFSPLNHEIAERKQIQEGLRDSEKRYRGFMEASPDAIAVFDENGRIIMLNSRMEKMFGYPRQELLGKSPEILMPERFRSRHIEHLAKFYANPTLRPMGVGCGAFALRKDGTEFPVDVSLGPLHAEEGLIVIAAIRDITERQQAEKALQESENRFRDFFANAPIGFHIFGPDQIITDINDAELDMIGYTHDEIVGKKTWADIIIPSQAEQFKKHWNDILTEGNVRNLEYTLVHKQGRHIDVLLNASSRFDETGKFINSRGNILNITERKQAKKMAFDLARILEESLNEIYIFDANTLKFLQANKGARANLGYSTEQLRELTPLDLKTGFSDEYFDDLLKPLRTKEKEQIEFVTKHQRKDGSFYDIEVHLEMTTFRSVPVFVAIILDITDRKRAEKALHESERKFRTLFEQSADAILIIEEGKFIDCNKASVKLLGYSNKEELLRTHPAQLSPEFQPDGSRSFEKANELMSVAFERGSNRFEWDHKRCNGEVFPVEVLLTAVTLADRNFLHVVWRDITERKHAEQERERLLKTLAAKNEDLQSIVYVASHDLKSPLVNIQGFSGELATACKQIEVILHSNKTPVEMQRELDSVLNNDIPESLRFIRAGTTKMQALLKGLLEVSRVGTAVFKTESIDVNEMVDLIITNIQYQITSSGTDVSIDDLPDCIGDSTHINQVFTNILNNAVKYLDPNRKGAIHVSGQVQGGKSIYCIEDNGLGIAPAHQPKIFELFHRLEPEGKVKGDGLGLTIARRILDREGGKIWVESESEKGSRFFVSLPHA